MKSQWSGFLKMNNYEVRLTSRLMGRQCKSCQQSYEGRFLASSPEEAVAAAKAAFKIDLTVHKVSVDKVSLV
ncbi:hypothetical protein BvCms16BK_04544 [Escherichia coli]|nr:hypothetical protein BvCms16BK_04544 [Escherichia coli]